MKVCLNYTNFFQIYQHHLYIVLIIRLLIYIKKNIVLKFAYLAFRGTEPF
jgi:hypothetical protein